MSDHDNSTNIKGINEKNVHEASLTQPEADVLTNLARAWDGYLSLVGTGGDTTDFRTGINACQRLIAVRVAARVDPDVWNLDAVQ